MNDDCMKPELGEFVCCLVSPYYVVKFADFEKPCRRRSGGLFPRVLSVATRMACRSASPNRADFLRDVASVGFYGTCWQRSWGRLWANPRSRSGSASGYGRG